MYAGGSLIATDGTHTMRAVVRVMASKHDALWRRKDHVWLFKPDDLHIAHVYWYATRPELIHPYHLLTAPYQALHVQVEPIEEIQRREREARSSYISELDFTGHARGGPNFTRGYTFKLPARNQTLLTLAQHANFHAIDPELLDSV